MLALCLCHRGSRTSLWHLADHTDAATTTATAKMIGYPTTGVVLGDQHRAWRPVVLALAGLALALLVGLAPALVARRRRRPQRDSMSTTESTAERETVNVTA